MSAEETTPSLEWRAAQHRVRNDLQTLASLVRLSQRRDTGPSFATEVSGWLSGMAAVYDVQPLWDNRETISFHALADALHGRCEMQIPVVNHIDADLAGPSTSALAISLAFVGLLSFCCASVRPRTPVRLGGHGNQGTARVEAVFHAAQTPPPGWPPPSLSLAAQALGGECAMGEDGDETVVVLVLPCL